MARNSIFRGLLWYNLALTSFSAKATAAGVVSRMVIVARTSILSAASVSPALVLLYDHLMRKARIGHVDSSTTRRFMPCNDDVPVRARVR